MFREWLSKNRIENIPLEVGKIIPSASDRGYWDNLVGQKDYDEWISRAEELLGYSWPIIKATDFLAVSRTGSRAAMEDVFNARRGALTVLVTAECLEYKGRFLDDIINGIFTTCEETYWGLSGHFRSIERHNDRKLPPWENDANLDLLNAETASGLSWTYYLLKDKLSQIDPYLEGRLYYEIDRRVLQNFMVHDNYWWMGFGERIPNNWNPWIISNMISGFMIMEKNEKKRYDGIRRCMVVLDNFLKHYPEDGGCDEGVTYWAVNGGALYDCLEQLYLASGGEVDFYSQPMVKKIVRFFATQHISGKYVVNFADGSSRPNVDTSVIYRYGRAVGDEGIMALAADMHSKRDYLVRDPVRVRPAIMGLTAYKALDECTLPQSYERDVCYENIQVVNGGQSDKKGDGLYLAVKGGFNNESHNHNDIGTYIVYIDGQPAAIDVGVGVYTQKTFSGQRYDIWSMQSQWHNLPLVNLKGQKDGDAYRSTLFTHEFSDDATVVRIGMEGAYQPDAGLEKLTRTVTLDRVNEQICVEDDFAFIADSNTVTEHIMLCSRPKVEPGRVAVTLNGGSAAVIEFDSDYEVSVDSMDISGDGKFVKSWNTDVLYRVGLTAKTGKTAKIAYSIRKDK